MLDPCSGSMFRIRGLTGQQQRFAIALALDDCQRICKQYSALQVQQRQRKTTHARPAPPLRPNRKRLGALCPGAATSKLKKEASLHDYFEAVRQSGEASDRPRPS